jgi:hypothetical protein
MLGVPEVIAALLSLPSRPRARSPFIQSIMLIVKSDGPSMSSLRTRGISRSATGDEEMLEPSKASRSSSYLEVSGDAGSGLGDAPRGGDDCILLESIVCRLLVLYCYAVVIRYQWHYAYPVVYMRTRFATSWEVFVLLSPDEICGLMLLLLIMWSLARTDFLNRKQFVITLGYGCGVCCEQAIPVSTVVDIAVVCFVDVCRNNSIQCLL